MGNQAKSVAGTLNTGGAVTRLLHQFRTLTGAESFTGTVVKHSHRWRRIIGQINLSGSKSSLAHHIRAINGSESLNGGVIRHIHRFREVHGFAWLSGNASRIGAHSRTAVGIVSFSGGATRIARRYQNLSGSEGLSSGVSGVIVHHPHSGSISVSGILGLYGNVAATQRKLSRFAAGDLQSTGVAYAVTARPRMVEGSMGLHGAVLHDHGGTQKQVGTVGMTGGIFRAVGKNVSGTILTTGNVTRVVHRFAGVAGSINAVGGNGAHPDKVALSGIINFSGGSDSMGRLILGNLGLSGRVWISAKGVQGTLGFPRTIPGLRLSGDLSRVPSVTQNGTLSLSGSLGNARPSGTLSLSGNLTGLIVPLLYGDLNLTGALLRKRTYTRAVGGGLSFMRVLTGSYNPANIASPLNLAATKDLVIEQGANFRRMFRWMKSDGIPYDLTHVTIYMRISNVKGAGDMILDSYSGIVVTKTVDPGVFEVDIPTSITSVLDFTRAVYAINASWGVTTVRLVEGEVVLSKGLFRHVEVNVGGALGVSGVLTEIHTQHVSKSVSGTLTLTGIDDGSPL